MWKCGRCEIHNAEETAQCVVCGFSRAESQANYLRIAAQRQAAQPHPEPATTPEQVSEPVAETPKPKPEVDSSAKKKAKKKNPAPVPVAAPKVPKERHAGKIVGIILACLALLALTACIVGVIYLAMDSETEQTVQPAATEIERSVYYVLSKMWQ